LYASKLQNIDLNCYFNCLINLEDLDISSNNLTCIEANLFLRLIKLKKLNLSHGKIEKIDLDGFCGLSNLEFLDLSDNKCSHMDPKSFVHLVKLKHLNLRKSSFYVNQSWTNLSIKYN
jgi:Leucine-rich repeat (LRR) protein